MKVILNSFGVMEDKRFLKAIDGMTEFEWRTNPDVIALIEKKLSEISYLSNLLTEKRISESQLSKYNKLVNCDDSWLYFKIVEVDTSRKWAIGDYDSSKYIQYFDVVDSSINFYGFI